MQIKWIPLRSITGIETWKPHGEQVLICTETYNLVQLHEAEPFCHACGRNTAAAKAFLAARTKRGSYDRKDSRC